MKYYSFHSENGQTVLFGLEQLTIFNVIRVQKIIKRAAERRVLADASPFRDKQEFSAAMSEAEAIWNIGEAFINSGSTQAMAEECFGGDERADCRAVAAFHESETDTSLRHIDAYGFMAKSTGHYVGHIKALEKLDRLFPGETVLSERQQNMIMRYHVDRQLAAVLTGDSSDMGFMQYMMVSCSSPEFVLTEEWARNLTQYMKAKGWWNFDARKGCVLSIPPAKGFRYGRILPKPEFHGNAINGKIYAVLQALHRIALGALTAIYTGKAYFYWNRFKWWFGTALFAMLVGFFTVIFVFVGRFLFPPWTPDISTILGLIISGGGITVFGLETLRRVRFLHQGRA